MIIPSFRNLKHICQVETAGGPKRENPGIALARQQMAENGKHG
jgi:hypothetical protein